MFLSNDINGQLEAGDGGLILIVQSEADQDLVTSGHIRWLPVPVDAPSEVLAGRNRASTSHSRAARVLRQLNGHENIITLLLILASD